MSTLVEFIDSLLRSAPQLEQVYREHLRENDELLAHVFFGDVTRYVIEEARTPEGRDSLRPLIQVMEEGLATDNAEIQELVEVSFVENLTGERTTRVALRPLIGPLLERALDRICD